jgi:serine/threonine protein kinase
MNSSTSHSHPDPDDLDDGDPRVFAAVQEYLAAAEAGNPIPRREFLLRHPEIADELASCLDGLALVQAAASEIPGAPPRPKRKRDLDPAMAQPIGDFQLVQEIGHGGMGTVYEAIQLSLGRRVAVKVLPLAAALDARHLERFHLEAQAAARLHHTNIVPVHAVGCERSVHFYAMQLIDGQSLAEVIRDLKLLAARNKGDAQKDDAGQDGDIDKTAHDLSTLRHTGGSAYAHSVARLAIQAAEALAYAHDAGVVHRDVKPANLMLDSTGKLWITDFGLAHMYAESQLTRTGDFVGTLRYMSPEQAAGRAVVLDQRTDIYSLGVTLYELLTLEPALPGTTHAELLLQHAEYQPRSLRSIDRTIPAELDTIITKAIAKDPADRYQTAGALADDLRRFLRDEPILARPPSMGVKARKWVRRHKYLSATVFALLALATLGFSISTFLIAREQERTEVALDLEKQRALEAQAQRVRAERSGQLARQAVEYFARIASEEMEGPQFASIRREMLEESLAYFESLNEEHGPGTSASAELDSDRTRFTRYLDLFTSFDGLMEARNRTRLLSEPSVQQDLKITRDQADDAFEAAQDAEFSAPATTASSQHPWPQQRTLETQARISRIDSAIAQSLGAKNALRLHQIQRQLLGPLAFDEPEAIDQLALDENQRSQIRAMIARYRNIHLTPGSQNVAYLAKIKAATLAKILALLTPDQLQRWNDVIGTPFTGSVRPGPGEGLPPRPPPGMPGEPPPGQW